MFAGMIDGLSVLILYQVKESMAFFRGNIPDIENLEEPWIILTRPMSLGHSDELSEKVKLCDVLVR